MLVKLLNLETIGPDSFEGGSAATVWKRVYGGQAIAQSLIAAERTVDGKTPHSLHAYFLLAGDLAEPIRYEVERIRDGRSFATRRVVASQRGGVIFTLAASFHADEAGLEHQLPMPEAPAPDEVADPATLIASKGEDARRAMANFLRHVWPIEFRPLDPTRYDPPFPGAPRDPRQSLWIRIGERLPDNPTVHRAALAYLSDMTLLDTILVTHGLSLFTSDYQGASLDHALWFHRPARADDWLLYVQDSPTASGGRGFTRGLLYSRAGDLVASVTQEGLVRRKRPKAPTD